MKEPLLNLTEKDILDSIGRWKENSRNGAALVSYLDQGNAFNYTYYNVHQGHHIHAYPGIYTDGKLYFFMIPAAYDNKDYETTFAQYTMGCPVEESLIPISGSHTIDPADALLRMNRWLEYYKTWVPKQAESAEGMFEAFNISVLDIEVPEVQMALALKLDLKDESIFVADMIVTNRTETKVFYDDFVRSVPPFDATLTPDQFYLLSIA